MGKGSGACFSNESSPAPSQAKTDQKQTAIAPQQEAAVINGKESAQQESTKQDSAKMATKKVYVIYYSMYGHIATMAKAVKAGIDSVEGMEGVLYQVAETLPEAVLAKMHAPPKDEAVPIVDAATINEADGFVFGFPTRFGTMPAQFKAFLDATGSHWQSGGLVGKPVSIFTSVASQGSGLETTILTALPNLTHQGMIFVPPGYSFGAKMFDLSAAKGGSPWGASTLAGPDGSRKPTEDEIAFAEHQGKYLAGIAKKLAA